MAQARTKRVQHRADHSVSQVRPKCGGRAEAALAAGSVHATSIAAIRHLLCLVEIACQRSFAKAADALAVSQLAIAKAMEGMDVASLSSRAGASV
ncbi:MAG: hypothetical protein C0452_13730 [Pseudomonas sp.]|nr:hypothetical protein [Pseudomonas sp.]